MNNLIQNILDRYSRAKSGTEKFYSMYKRGYELSAPNYNNVEPGAFQGQTGQPRVFDSTVSRAADAFVNTFITTICPPQTRWMELAPSENLIEELVEETGRSEQDISEELRDGYQYVTDQFFVALNQSNFYSILDQFSHDIFLGTGCLLVQNSGDYFDSASPLDFTAIPPLDISVELTPNQKITGVFRKQTLRVSQIKYVYPSFDYSTISGYDRMSNKDCDVEIIEACILDPKFVTKENGTVVRLRWRYLVVCNEGIAVDERFENNPFVVFFWSLRQKENVGRGLLTKLLPDANGLQAMVELKQKWMQMHAFGMYTASASMLLNPAMAKIRPNGVIMVKEQGAIQPLQPAGSPQVQQLQIQELQQAIKETALDFTVPNDPRMTATQVEYIAQRQLQIFSGVVGRIQFQFLWPIVQNSLSILVATGKIKMPTLLSKIDTSTTQLKILSPIGRVQFMNDLNSLMSALGSIGQIDPSLIQLYVKTEALPTYIFEQTGSPAKLLRSDEETEQIKQEMILQQQAAIEQQVQQKQ